MRVLVVEDDKVLHHILVKRLKEEGYSVDGCYDGESGFDYADSLAYDCIVLDLMLPKRDGISVLKELRGRGNAYLVKPFSFEELTARVRALLRRGGTVKSTVLSLGDLTVDTADRRVTRAGQDIALTSTEYALLEYLIRNQGHVLTRSQIADHVWNYDFQYDSNVVDVYIRYLRNKIDRPFSSPLIHTVRGTGYILREES